MFIQYECLIAIINAFSTIKVFYLFGVLISFTFDLKYATLSVSLGTV